MADDKKKFDKKKPEAPPSKTGHDVLWELIGFFIAAVILISALSSFSILNFLSTPSNTGSQNANQVTQGDYDFWKTLIGKADGFSFPAPGNLSLGVDVISKGLVQVRREPGGSVIGLQKLGETAKVVDGPVSAYGARWWMMDYANPPSGWVDEKDITTKFFWFYVINFFPILWSYIKTIGLILSGFFVLAIIYLAIRDSSVPLYDEQVEDKEAKEKISSVGPLTKTQTAPTNLPIGEEVSEPEENSRWMHVELLMKSHNTSDWRQAIIEADVMLEDMLDKMGYPGVSIGDKLKNIEENDFETLDKAWEAHKVRNRIAHDGGEYKLAYDEVARVIGLYRDVFKEFYWI
jgi:hypothetical protein